MLRQGLNAHNWSEEATYYYETLPEGTPKPVVEITGTVQVIAQPPTDQKLLLRHWSLPLVQILREMNVFSNNGMAEILATRLGGGSVVAQRAAWAASVPSEEIQLINGSGLGPQNQISPRAVCALFIAIHRYLQNWRSPAGTPYTIADVFPVAGRNEGTIAYRKMPPNAVVKTGTLDDVSALAGVLPTRDRGLVWFALINRGEDLDGFRSRQDQTLQILQKQWGVTSLAPTAVMPMEPPGVVNAPALPTAFGAEGRNQVF
nr:D-alanyl-D-alanine carboxypeptidase [Neosynechococcus sphagnicola]